MTEPRVCPGCDTVNKPAAAHCRLCGRSFRTSPGPRAQQQPVLLERVMSGEVFTAIIGHWDGAHPARKEPSRPRAPETQTESEAHAGALLDDMSWALQRKSAELGKVLERDEASTPRRQAREPSDDEALEALESAMSAMQEQRWDDAARLVRKALERNPDDARAWILLGESSLLSEQPIEAAAAFRSALGRNPRHEAGWLGLAKVFHGLDDLPRALAGVERAVELNPRMREAWIERGLVFEALHDLSEALRSFAKALELSPHDPFARARHASLGQRLRAEATRASGMAAGAEVPDVPEGTFGAPAPRRGAVAKVGAQPRSAANQTGESPNGRLLSRVRTYAEGLDDMMEGGIPRGHVVLIQGAPGTMKSSFAYSIMLQNAIRDGRHCTYITLEERVGSLLGQMASLDLSSEVTRGSLVFVDLQSVTKLLAGASDWIDAFGHVLDVIREERGLDIVVIDSLEALEVLAKLKNRRAEIFRLFEWLRQLEVTSLVIAERLDQGAGGYPAQQHWDEDFLADGLIQMRTHSVSDLEEQRRLRIVKMRGARHEIGYLALLFDEGSFRVTRALST